MNEFLRDRYKCLSEAICIEIKRFVNMLNLTYTFDMTHWNLSEKESVLDRKHVFHVKFPEEWTRNNIIQLFSAFGNVTIGWIDGTSALVGLREPSKWKEVKKNFQKGPPSLSYTVTAYEEYVKKNKSLERSENSISEQEQSKRKSPNESSDKNCDVNGSKKTKLFQENTDW